MEKKFIPAARFNWLTSGYDLWSALLGFGREYRQFVKSALNLSNRQRRVLDVGCGTGTLLIDLKKEYPENIFFGIDPDSKILAIAVRKACKAGGKVDFKQSFAQKLPFASSSIDVVYSSLVFHHLSHEIKKRTLIEIRRVLKKNGIFMLSDFGKPRHHGISFPWFAHTFEHGTDNYQGKLSLLIKEAGFHSVKKQGTYPHDIEIWKARK